MYDFKGKTAVITGGSGLIGSGISKVFAKNQCNLVIGYLNQEERARALAEQLETQYRVCIRTVRADLSIEGESEKLMDTARELGGADFLLNAFGGFQSSEETFADTSPEWFASFYQKNLDSLFLTYRAYVREMLRQKKNGCAVTVVEIPAVLPGEPARVCYGMVKEASIALSKTFAMENYRHGIRVNCVLPGFVQGTTQYDAAVAEKRSLIGQFADAQAVGNACAFLCSEESEYCVGTVLDVSGGRRF